MSLTKIGSIGINTGIAFAGVTTITTLNGSDAVLSVGGTVNFVSDVSIGGTVSIAGTLTYEDVTNVDAVGLITARDGIVVGSGITLSKDGDAFHTGVVTATTFVGNLTGNPTGSGANLTNLPAANVTGTLPAISGANLTNLTAGNLTGALPAISGANLTGIAATDNVRTGILDVAGVSTFRNTMNVGAAVTISESGIEASGIGITCANINGGQISGRRNIIINGDMQVAQRATSSTSSGYTTIDRWVNSFSADASATFTQHALTSSDSGPYEEGFRYSHHATNGDTAAGGTQYYEPQQPIEAQNVSLSGWNYKSSTSFITLSFWVKSSVGQEYQAGLLTTDGTLYKYPFAFTLSANTWTKVVKTIPGNSNLQIDNDNGEGLRVSLLPFMGTNYTDNSVSHDAWSAWSSSSRWKDSTSTWFTTNGATFEFTGVQLEAGSQATAFEHRSFAEELALCQRYYYIPFPLNSATTALCVNGPYTTSQSFGVIQFPTTMRAAPSGDIAVTTNYVTLYTPEATGGRGCSDVQVQELTKNSSRIYFTSYASNFSSATGGAGYAMVANNSFKLAFSAEL